MGAGAFLCLLMDTTQAAFTTRCLSAYGKPVLDRTLQYEDSLRFALKVGCLAFDSTRISAADVDYPIDVVIYAKNSYQITEHRYSKYDLATDFRLLAGPLAQLGPRFAVRMDRSRFHERAAGDG